MEHRVWNQESRRRVKTEQNTDAYPTGGVIGDRSSNLVKLIGAERVSQRNFKYEGTYYINKDTLRKHKYQDKFTDATYRDWETDRKSVV